MSIAAILGWFGDRSSSRRAPMLLGLVATAGATLILCLGSSIGVLVAGRFLQGASEAVVWTMGLALLVDTVGQDRIGEVLGYTSLAVTLGLLSAPPLCGSLYQWGGYYAPFYLAFGVVALDIALRLIMIEKKVAVTYTQPHRKACSAYGTLRQDADFRPQNTPAMDPERSHVASTAYEPQSDQEREPLIGSPESTEPKPRLTSGTPIVLTLLTSPRMLASLWGCFVDTALAVSFDTVLPLFLKETFKWDASQVGLMFLALLGPSFGTPAVGRLSDRVGSRWIATAGFLLCVPGCILLGFIGENTTLDKALLGGILALIGLGHSFVVTPLMAEITGVVAELEKQCPGMFGPSGGHAQAYGLYTCTFGTSTLIGPLASNFARERLGWMVMSWSMGGFCMISAIIAAVFTGQRKGARSHKAGCASHEEEGYLVDDPR